ncbi:TIGR01777 family protein [Thalassomonas viridans]|uniref:TIGR01777 family protein n=1 Tax=Thalassomonas viridans TaxID=137584 RepID=A0AAE9Z6L0_9GAMM|nr:TIGR01777 family oxidoreductase [Thalassomonas viridans]WDE07731.1 TIGR01777 family protein [Thalassomonas viridans]
MNILITGGTGLIGGHFIKKYQHKHHFTVLSRQLHPKIFSEETAKVSNGQQGKNAITLIQHLESYQNLDAFDTVINLQGESLANKRWSEKQKQLLCQSRWQITEHLARLINQSTSPPAVFLSGSAIGFYGRQQALDIDEDFTGCYPEFSHELCNTWEEKARQCQSNTRLCLLRTGIVLSKDGGALGKMLPPFSFGLGGPVADGRQYMSWIHIEDICRALDFLIEEENISGAVNLTAPTPVSNLEFSRALAKQLHRPCIFPMPGPVLKVLVGEMAELLIHGQHVVPKKLLDAGFTFNYPALKQALAQLLTT